MDRRPLAAAAACAALATAVYMLFANVALAQRVDLHVLQDAMATPTAFPSHMATGLVRLFDPAPFALLTGLLVAGAMLAGRVRAGLAAGGAVLAATVTTEVLKQVLAVQRPYPADHYMPAASWPSGHTTAVVSLLLALVIVLPPRLRPPIAVLGGAACAVALASIVQLGFHYPSDVVGGVLVATGWSAVALAVSGGGPAPTGARRRLLPRSRHATG
jgi:membrane-associated phospholipid phosphatase